MTWAILDRNGLVHRTDPGCKEIDEAVLNQRQLVRLSPLQARVYNLPSCGRCFPDVRVYLRERAA